MIIACLFTSFLIFRIVPCICEVKNLIPHCYWCPAQGLAHDRSTVALQKHWWAETQVPGPMHLYPSKCWLTFLLHWHFRMSHKLCISKMSIHSGPLGVLSHSGLLLSSCICDHNRPSLVEWYWVLNILERRKLRNSRSTVSSSEKSEAHNLPLLFTQ